MLAPKAILVLGGTTEARQLASRLAALGHDVTTSLAGVTTSPKLPEGNVRVGGFGGKDGLREYLSVSHTELMVDATHPFAAQMSFHAHQAAKQLGLQLLRLERPAWSAQEGDNWLSVSSMAEAAAHIPKQSLVFVTTGRKNLGDLLVRPDVSGIIRVVEPLSEPLPFGWEQMLDRPPFDLEQELMLFKRHRFTHLLSKNSGGDGTSAKLEAARMLKVPVVMLSRPAKPDCACFSTVDEVIAALGRGRLAG